MKRPRLGDYKNVQAEGSAQDYIDDLNAYIDYLIKKAEDRRRTNASFLSSNDM